MDYDYKDYADSALTDIDNIYYNGANYLRHVVIDNIIYTDKCNIAQHYRNLLNTTMNEVTNLRSKLIENLALMKEIEAEVESDYPQFPE